jgi:hypothetical protein
MIVIDYNAWNKISICESARWLRPVILANQEAKIGKPALGKNTSQETISEKKKKKSQKRASGVAQGVGLEFKPQYPKQEYCCSVYHGLIGTSI